MLWKELKLLDEQDVRDVMRNNTFCYWCCKGLLGGKKGLKEAFGDF